MIPDPIHPMVVHFPIVLSVALPISALWALWTISRTNEKSSAWILPTLLAVALVTSTFLAVKTGEEQEPQVEPVVGEAPLHTHEEAAELFLILTGGVAVLMGGGLLPGRAGNAARVAGTVSTAVLLTVGAHVGSSGGELVYRYGAPIAYGAQTMAASEAQAPHLRTSEAEHDGERGERP